jgi:hypothetical protein
MFTFIWVVVHGFAGSYENQLSKTIVRELVQIQGSGVVIAVIYATLAT